MGDRLKADLDHIRQAGHAIKDLSTEFRNAGDIVADYDDALGDAHLRDKLHEFASNWDIHRKRLTEDLDNFAKWALDAADAYAHGDQQLADALEKGAQE
jgi:hypothetical protein